MKIVSLLIVLLVLIEGFAQSYEPLSIFQVSGSVKDLEIDEENSLIYISSAQNTNVFNIENNELHEIQINEKDLPEFRYYSKEFSQETNMVSDPESLRRSLFTENGDYLIFYWLEHQYEYLFVYKRNNMQYDLHRIFNNRANANSVAVNRDLKLAVGSGGGQIRIWDIEDKNFVRLMKPEISNGAVFSIQFSDINENKIIISNGASECIIIDIETDQVYGSWKYGFSNGHGQQAMQMYLTNEDSLALVGLRNGYRNSLNIWATTNEEAYSISTNIIEPIVFDITGSVLYIGDSSCYISVYNLLEGEISNVFTTGQYGLELLEFSNYGKYMVTTDGEGEIKVWRKNEFLTEPK